MNLDDDRPRSILVYFEVSDADQPGALDRVYTAPFAARVAPGPDPGQITVTIDAEILERHLLGDTEPVPGSFSDFEWVFDRLTGHVEQASATGAIYRSVDWGWFETRVQAEIEIGMDTRRSGGFEPPRQLFGQIMRHYCDPKIEADCQRVPSLRYNPNTGYVNAVGSVSWHSAVYDGRAFSPLGEAVFVELDEGPTTEARARFAPPAVSAGPASTPN